MGIIQEIVFQVIEILTLIFGVLGITFSTMLMFSPRLTKNLSNILNRNVNVDEKIRFLDKDIEISEYLYSHHLVVGLLLIFGSAFALFFFYFSLDIAQFINVFFDSPTQVFFGEILLKSILWVGKITCLTGLFFGGFLMSAPRKMKKWEKKLNSWFETGAVIEKLERSSDNVDSFFFRHPLPLGLMGAGVSFLIISLSIINLLN
ncbi:hypothetical protein D1BOALGB6SA_10359 [Olavius sp. associated proteobacterium Delta 1]|nr:hypothetical protein D1BOALGB6SA_10359 [Olavius sp. associated proteobacterium Delta 1]